MDRLQFAEEADVIYELRIYRHVPGGLPRSLEQFDKVTLPLWRKHGIEQAGFWTVAVGESNQDLYYLLRWDSMAEREQKWAAFQKDPDWAAWRAEAAKRGPPHVASVQNMFLAPTAFSAAK